MVCIYTCVLLSPLGGKVDAVTFSTGTGGTLAGVGMFLKSKNPNVKVVVADPQVKRVMGTSLSFSLGFPSVHAMSAPLCSTCDYSSHCIKLWHNKTQNQLTLHIPVISKGLK